MKIVSKRFAECITIESNFEAFRKHVIIVGYRLVYLLYSLNNGVLRVYVFFFFDFPSAKPNFACSDRRGNNNTDT